MSKKYNNEIGLYMALPFKADAEGRYIPKRSQVIKNKTRRKGQRLKKR